MVPLVDFHQHLVDIQHQEVSLDTQVTLALGQAMEDFLLQVDR